MRQLACALVVAAGCLFVLSSCSRNDSDEVAKLKAELAAAKKSGAAKPPANPNVTLETFIKIQPGTTYAAVQELFGDTGQSSWERSSESDFGRHWNGKQEMAADPNGPVPRIDVDFEQNQVTGKRATNLK